MKKQPTFRSLLYQQQVLSVLLLTVVAIMVWVGFAIYFSYSKTTLKETDTTLMSPLNPKLDTTVFEKLRERKTWTDSELENFSTSVESPIVAQISLPQTASQTASASAR